MTSRAIRRAAAGLVIPALAVALAPAALAAPPKKLPPVHVRGTVYTFDNQEPIEGATVKVAELPGVSATSGPDGTYDLLVPDGTAITPYAEATGHRGLHLQTFVTRGRDLERVNHQIPRTNTYFALAAVLGVKLDSDDNPEQCVVVSTFSTVNVRDASFAEFVAYGAHGVAGATGFATPALGPPTYFNEFVFPDPAQTSSSIDGGVVWIDIPAGVYRFRAEHPTTRFGTFRATCMAGRVINANPPQGLYELRPGEVLDTTVDAKLARPSFPSGPGRLKVKVSGGEYVSAVAELLRGGKRVARRAPSGYRPGPRRLKLPVGAKLAGKRLTLEVTVEDGEGNAEALTRRVRVPRARR